MNYSSSLAQSFIVFFRADDSELRCKPRTLADDAARTADEHFRAIIEIKPFQRGKVGVRIRYQKSAQMAAWIYSHTAPPNERFGFGLRNLTSPS